MAGQKEPTPEIVQAAGILGITALSGWALYLGHNGLLLALALSGISGIAGYSLGSRVKKATDKFGVTE